MKYLGLLFLFLLLLFSPFFWVKNGQFLGSDDQMIAVITEIKPAYHPWFSWWWRPKPEVAGLFFSLQVGIGAMVFGIGMGHHLGFKKGYKSAQRALAPRIQKDI